MDDKILERMLDNLIEEAGKVAINNMESKEEEIPEVQFSKEHEEKVKKIFADARKEKEAKNKLKVADELNEESRTEVKSKKKKFKFKRMLILAATLILVLGLLTTTNGWRDSFLKYFFDFKEEYSDVKNVNLDGNSFKIADAYFGYVPEGFKYEVLKEASTQTIIDFVNDNEYFMFKYSKGEWNGKVNTENAILEEITIAGRDMVYYENEEEKSLSWQENNRTCLLTTNCKKELLLKIAKEIKLEDKGPQN